MEMDVVVVFDSSCVHLDLDVCWRRCMLVGSGGTRWHVLSRGGCT